MSVRHFNYTSRQRLRQADTLVTLLRVEDDVSFEANIRLDDYDLPADGIVVVEAYRQTSMRRFRFGRVANPHPEGPTDLSGLPHSDALLFRVKVIDATGSGRLLAEADRISPVDPEGGDRPSLVRVRETDLSGELWQLSLEEDGPVLLLEKRYGPREVLLGSAHFRWLVIPQLYRELLRAALLEFEDDEDNGASTAWHAQLVRQAVTTAGDVPSERDSDELENWITSAVRALCRRNGFAQRYSVELFGGSES